MMDPTNTNTDPAETEAADPARTPSSPDDGTAPSPSDMPVTTNNAREEKGELEVADEQETEPAPYVPKLNERQQKIWQIVLGILFGFGIWYSLWLSTEYPDDQLLSWLFIIVFAVAMFGRNAVEKKTGVSLRTFMKYFLISLIVFLGLFILLRFVVFPG